MKRINPETNQPYRCGDVHPTNGMIFRCYNLQRLRRDGTYIEQWLEPDVFNQIKERMLARAKTRRLKASTGAASSGGFQNEPL